MFSSLMHYLQTSCKQCRQHVGLMICSLVIFMLIRVHNDFTVIMNALLTTCVIYEYFTKVVCKCVYGQNTNEKFPTSFTKILIHVNDKMATKW